LKAKGFKVFYDKDAQALLWGKNSKIFEKIYGPHSRVVIPIISKHYVRKPWTRFEFETAYQEQQKRKSDFILPIRLDRSRLLGLHTDAIQLDGNKITHEEIVKLFARKYRPQRRASETGDNPKSRLVPIELLDTTARRALGLIATAPSPLPVEFYTKLFPLFDWPKLTGTFQSASLIAIHHGLVEATGDAAKLLLSDGKDKRDLTEYWISHLSPLKEHVDIAAFLASQLVSLGRIDEAANVAAEIAESQHLGWWNQIYLTFFRGVAGKRLFRRLQCVTRVRVLNSFGNCLSRAGMLEDAAKVYARLKVVSRKQGDRWGLGQYYINAGVTAHRAGDSVGAQQLYAEAVKHARRTRDHLLLGRALSNLAQVMIAHDANVAMRLLDKSIDAKKLANDASGLVVALGVRGTFAAEQEEFREAAKWFRKCAGAASRLRLTEDEARAIYNEGKALLDAGDYRPAVERLRKSRSLAKSQDIVELILLSLHAEGGALFELGRFKDAEQVGNELLDAARRAKDTERDIAALHLMAASALAQDRAQAGRKLFSAAIKLARQIGSAEWLGKCLIDSARESAKPGVTEPREAQLSRLATAEARRGEMAVAASLWAIVATLRRHLGAPTSKVIEALQAADACLPYKAETLDDRLELYRRWYSWAWEAAEYKVGLAKLTDLERLAQKHGREADAIAALDQRGVSLQELGKFEEAAGLHAAAAKAAVRLGDEALRRISLNNLGEAMRNLGRFREALSPLQEAEQLARSAGETAEAISAAHNRALALEQGGKRSAAKRLLERCRDLAKGHKIWNEYVRALEGLANLAWDSGDVARAEALYKAALRTAKSRSATDREPEIGLNLARLLHWRGRARQALRVIAPLSARFDENIDSHHYFGTLAQLHEDVGELKLSLGAWETAQQRAERFGDHDFALDCISHRAQLLAKLGQASLSAARIKEAIKAEGDPARRAKLLIRSLQIRLETDPDSATQEMFDETLAFCDAHHLIGEKVALYLLVADHDLSGNYQKKLNAMKGYALAMINAFDGNGSMEGFGEVGSHVLMKVASAGSPVRPEELPRLAADLEAYIRSQTEDADLVVGLALYPLKMAEQLAPYRNSPKAFVKQLEALVNTKGSMEALGLLGKAKRP
jgi:tetratricopeptide (TPR) repeat protein